jgi:hypothetical protein
MQISGHKKEKDFYRYIKTSPEEAAKIIQRIWQERNNMQAFNPSGSLLSSRSLV